jgi:hypothetical protein
MPEEIEVPTEHLHEAMHEAAHGHGGPEGGHGGGHAGGPAEANWIPQVALSAAVVAVAAAIAALLAGHHANEAMLEQMQATDSWALYQAKGIKGAVAENENDLLLALGKEPREESRKKVERYKEEQKEIEEKAREQEHSSQGHLNRHLILARSVTSFQVAIALSAICVLTRKKGLWYVSLAIGVIGAFFFITAQL